MDRRARIPLFHSHQQSGWSGPFGENEDGIGSRGFEIARNYGASDAGDTQSQHPVEEGIEGSGLWKNFSAGIGLVVEARDKAFTQIETATESVRKVGDHPCNRWANLV